MRTICAHGGSTSSGAGVPTVPRSQSSPSTSLSLKSAIAPTEVTTQSGRTALRVRPLLVRGHSRTLAHAMSSAHRLIVVGSSRISFAAIERLTDGAGGAHTAALPSEQVLRWVAG